ncbi:MAG: exodeoxyribonuclease VII large subunit [Deltaproteobacteria bacterium]|nr:exodeoxyribonuclease VII large subunit [Deltaproteobacteria bacterium]
MLLPFLNEQTSVYTVSDLNGRIRNLLESNLNFVWVKGEISNFRIPGSSGHWYFTLKDERSQIRAVFFKGQRRNLRFQPESGLQVVCQGRVSVYEPRGEYQLIVELMEPQGIGALQLAFEQLKKKLDAEGLFHPDRKLPLPTCPQRIGIITSPTGAAVRDILKVLQRSPYPLSVTLLPVRVQGMEAAGEITAALSLADSLADVFQWDLLIVGRGGGSMEDLQPFNEEVVARAIAASSVPIISAVGHEIDFSISDLVADLRMPTPTAAGEWIVGRLQTLERELTGYRDHLQRLLTHKLDYEAQRLHYLEKRLVHPGRKLEDLRLALDDRMERLQLAYSNRLEGLRTIHSHLRERMLLANPGRMVQQTRRLLFQSTKDLLFHYRSLVNERRLRLQGYAERLEGLNPLSVLARGYSITYLLPGKAIVRRSSQVLPGQDILVQLSVGELTCTVKETK